MELKSTINKFVKTLKAMKSMSHKDRCDILAAEKSEQESVRAAKRALDHEAYLKNTLAQFKKLRELDHIIEFVNEETAALDADIVAFVAEEAALSADEQ